MRSPRATNQSRVPCSPASDESCGAPPPWARSHRGGLVVTVGGHGQTQALVLLVLAVRVPQIGVQSEATAAGGLGAQMGRAPDSVFVRGLVQLVIHHVVVDDVDPVKSGRLGHAPLAF